MGHIDRVNNRMTHSTALFALFAALLCASSYCEVSKEVSDDIVPENSDSLIQDLEDDSPRDSPSDDDLVQSKEKWYTRRLTPPSNMYELTRCARRYCKPTYYNRRVDCGSKQHAYLVAINCLIGTAA